MISANSIVTIGDEQYVVTTAKQHQCACTVSEPLPPGFWLGVLLIILILVLKTYIKTRVT